MNQYYIMSSWQINMMMVVMTMCRIKTIKITETIAFTSVLVIYKTMYERDVTRIQRTGMQSGGITI